MYKDWLVRGLEKPGKSQRGLAAALGVSESVVSRMVSGRRALRDHEITVISSYLGAPPPGTLQQPAATLSGGKIAYVGVEHRSLEGAFMDVSANLTEGSVEQVPFVPPLNVDRSILYAVEIISVGSGDRTYFFCTRTANQASPAPREVLHCRIHQGKLSRDVIMRLDYSGILKAIPGSAEVDLRLSDVEVVGRVVGTTTVFGPAR